MREEMWHPTNPQCRRIVLTALTILMPYRLGDRDPLGMLPVLCRNFAPHWLYWFCWYNLPLIS
jgi:hypothetical protein